MWQWQWKWIECCEINKYLWSIERDRRWMDEWKVKSSSSRILLFSCNCCWLTSVTDCNRKLELRGELSKKIVHKVDLTRSRHLENVEQSIDSHSSMNLKTFAASDGITSQVGELLWIKESENALLFLFKSLVLLALMMMWVTNSVSYNFFAHLRYLIAPVCSTTGWISVASFRY